MTWLQIILTARRGHTALIEAALENAGAFAVTLADAGDEPQLEPAPGATPLWSRVCITALFPNDPENRARAERLSEFFADQLAKPVRFEELEDRPWERAWLDDFAPTPFGRHLWVCPRGQSASVDDAVVVELDPGLAFGTGHHATTALCLRWLDSAALNGATVLDYGCGSGILAISALRLGAARATAVDHDPQALEATRANAHYNKVADRLQVCTPGELPELQADVALANILAGPLVDLAPRLGSLVCPGGRLILSGLLPEQVNEVTSAYKACFDFGPPQFAEDWVLLSARRGPGT